MSKRHETAPTSLHSFHAGACTSARRQQLMKPQHPLRSLVLIIALGAAVIAPTRISAATPPGIPDGWSDGFVYFGGRSKPANEGRLKTGQRS